MQTILNDAELELVARLSDILQRGNDWCAAEFRLDGAHGLPEDIKNRLITVLQSIVKDKQASLFSCHHGHIILLLPSPPTSLINEIYRQVGPLLAQDMPLSESGCCVLYRSTDEFIALHKMAMHYAIQKRIVANPEHAYRPDAALFKHARTLRRVREKLCILVMEDQRFSQQLVVEIIGKGFAIEVADNGLEGLKKYETTAPDLVFIDIDMPTLDGLDVLEHVAALDRDHFAIMLTANREEKDVQRAVMHGAKGYIVKPFSRAKINQALGAFFKRHPDRAMKL